MVKVRKYKMKNSTRTDLKLDQIKHNIFVIECFQCATIYAYTSIFISDAYAL